ncbi:hypothetical protein I3760_15G087300 [Carya illinoinensis]|nr:hypothetical protein I3760_15G087300 [Carya illinoinensis]
MSDSDHTTGRGGSNWFMVQCAPMPRCPDGHSEISLPIPLATSSTSHTKCRTLCCAMRTPDFATRQQDPRDLGVTSRTVWVLPGAESTTTALCRPGQAAVSAGVMCVDGKPAWLFQATHLHDVVLRAPCGAVGSVVLRSPPAHCSALVPRAPLLPTEKPPRCSSAPGAAAQEVLLRTCCGWHQVLRTPAAAAPRTWCRAHQ